MKPVALLGALLVLLGAGCAAATTTDTTSTEGVSETTSTVHASEIWKEVIAPSCQSFFDGCNVCNRVEGSDVVACTKMACQTYERPVCNDTKEDVSENSTNTERRVELLKSNKQGDPNANKYDLGLDEDTTVSTTEETKATDYNSSRSNRTTDS